MPMPYTHIHTQIYLHLITYTLFFFSLDKTYLEAGVLQDVDQVAQELVGVLLPPHAEVLVEALEVPVKISKIWGGRIETRRPIRK